MMYSIAIPRFFLFVMHLFFGLNLALLLTVLLGRRWYLTMPGGFIKRMWIRQLAMILNLKISHSGETSGKPVVFVSNHISWLDVVALGCNQNCVFVAKNSVKKWPLIGIVASLSGTLFIDRTNKKDVVKTLRRGNRIIGKGVSLAFFPEATTTNGKQVKPFRTSLYQTAINSRSDVQAIGIRYPKIDDRDSPAPYIDDETFISHLFKILCTKRIDVNLSYCEPVINQPQLDRKQLAETTQLQVTEILALNHS